MVEDNLKISSAHFWLAHKSTGVGFNYKLPVAGHGRTVVIEEHVEGAKEAAFVGLDIQSTLRGQSYTMSSGSSICAKDDL